MATQNSFTFSCIDLYVDALGTGKLEYGDDTSLSNMLMAVILLADPNIIFPTPLGELHQLAHKKTSKKYLISDMADVVMELKYDQKTKLEKQEQKLIEQKKNFKKEEQRLREKLKKTDEELKKLKKHLKDYQTQQSLPQDSPPHEPPPQELPRPERPKIFP